ncbi:pirin family protein [Pontibacter sp. E15-1]|uniref:pirin family protein n=1 Tax=Pontibacter sp. E15-1 TaxID=2919918 RepID=UPI001F4FA5F8|nr:pirin family protein [Pontibacter sp. E15-1]MCJ8164475.1 pirin family protein [Pontibacter sp. E15-1]
MSKKVMHKAATRGHANHGWLNSHHSFSFASYHNPERMGFGLLRVLNDDEVAAGMGFGAHPHDNMEIVSIPLEGELAHKDSTGNSKIIQTNEVQIMSAGTGLTHSEFNHSKTDPVKFLQIWVFPKERNIEPRYEQKAFRPEDRVNQLQTVVSPDKNGDAIWINQDAWFTLGSLKEGFSEEYKVHKPGNGVYAFVLEGEVEIDGEKLGRRDGLGISETEAFQIKASGDAELLLMEVPMQ